jgi:hypothetical protein
MEILCGHQAGDIAWFPTGYYLIKVPLEQYLASRKYVFIIINDKNIGLL